MPKKSWFMFFVMAVAVTLIGVSSANAAPGPKPNKDERLDALEARIEALETRMNDAEGRLSILETDLSMANY